MRASGARQVGDTRPCVYLDHKIARRRESSVRACRNTDPFVPDGLGIAARCRFSGFNSCAQCSAVLWAARCTGDQRRGTEHIVRWRSRGGRRRRRGCGEMEIDLSKSVIRVVDSQYCVRVHSEIAMYGRRHWDIKGIAVQRPRSRRAAYWYNGVIQIAARCRLRERNLLWLRPLAAMRSDMRRLHHAACRETHGNDA